MSVLSVSKRDVLIELARREFWEYLKLKDPDFYKESRPHLKEFAQILQKFWERTLLTKSGKIAKILVINLPPRVGKSYTLTNFCSWVLGKSMHDPNLRVERIITISYSDDMATDFSRFCRDNILEERGSKDDIVFGDIFKRELPDGELVPVRIGKGDGAAKKWALEGEFFNYLGTGFKGQLTGKGASLGIIDDPVKNREEAYNENTLEFIWNFYKNTFRSRIENGGLQIINHTRWRNEDLAGRVMDMYGDNVYVHKRAIIENEKVKRIVHKDPNTGRVLRTEDKTVGGDLLCEELCDFENFLDLQEAIDEDIFRANYFQEPLDVQGRMYEYFTTYDPSRKFTETNRICSYCDTADTGDDYLCNIVYREVGRQAFITDVYYTKESMEVTEKETAAQIHFNKVAFAKIESNNGGRGFARAVERILSENYGNHSTVVSWFHQSKNKQTRILTQSAWIQKNFLLPADWAKRWPEFHKAMIGYQKEGKNKHDDAPDASTGVAEQFQPTGGMPIFNPDRSKLKFRRGFTRWQ